MKGLRTALLALLTLVGLIVPAVAQTPAVEIFYEPTNPGGGTQWQYSYTIRNNAFADPYGGVVMFNIYFPVETDSGGHYVRSDYSDLQPAGTLPTNWRIAGDAQGNLIQPGVNQFFQYRGVYGASGDDSHTITPIKPGDSLGGFDVIFNYSGGGTPGPQEFEVFDFDSLEVAVSGTTQLMALVPSPPSIFLLAASLLGLGVVGRKR